MPQPTPSRDQVIGIIEQEARRSGIPHDDFLKFAAIETGGRFDPSVSRGAHGAKGLFQFEPAAASHYGIRGQELDAAANTHAAARMYLDNRHSLEHRHTHDGRPYLSGKATPDGFDMYVAHQQGSGGYASIQAAIASGEFNRTDTRGNILNNMSDRDIQRLTGHTYAQASHMSDRALATTYRDYWEHKFERMPVPGHQQAAPAQPAAAHPAQAHPQPHSSPAQPSQPAANPAAPASGDHKIALDAAYDLSRKYEHKVAYGFGQKDPDSGKVDCSGWVVKAENATLDEINHKAGREVFNRRDYLKTQEDCAADIIRKVEKHSGVMLEGRAVTKDALKEGMVIGECNGAKFAKGRYHDIDHITMVVRDPKSGELMISQSSSHQGVHLTPVDDYLKYKQSHGVALYATDPLAKARGLMQDRQHVQAESRTEPRHEPQPNAPVRPAHAREAAPALLKEGSHGAEVGELQGQLRHLGYTGADGRPLAVDHRFGPDTRHAVESYQRDHKLHPDGAVGPVTSHSLAQARAQDAAHAPRLDQANHPDHGLYNQARNAVHRLDAAHGRAPDQVSDQIAGSVAVAAKQAGLTRVDQVMLSDDRSRVYAVQGDLNSPFKQVAQVDTAQAASTSLQQSSQAMQAVNQHQASQQPAQHQQQAQQQNQAQAQTGGMAR
ncbi:peptidoglycan-binding protein [Dyella marensis]|uniref:Putative peptidoglycan binding domain-containing protein n=1 Tax=Dyella marensis TaxID=500610 RepID=A0A1I1Z1T6_9GAMM|nr:MULTISPECIES: XVIPCD domain-containing protein [Dyella]SFE25532.1 Putative peptidoglycan binding domain-containing protein [Dyella marensis]